MMNGQILNIGDRFGTYKVTRINKINNRTFYDTQCEKCEYIRENRIGHYVRKGLKCQFCSSMQYIGKKNGMLTFLKFLGNQKYECICDCGNTCISEISRKSCGCLKSNGSTRLQRNLEKFSKMIGIKHKNLRVIGIGIKNRRCNLLVLCKCGKKIGLEPSDFFRYQSCGCRKYMNQARGSRQGNANLNESTVASLRDMYLTGMYTKKNLSEMFGIPIGNLRDILKNRSWKHVEFNADLLKKSPMKNTIYRKSSEKIEIGKIYGNWKVIEKAESLHRQARFLCECSCGARHPVNASSLRREKSKQSDKCHRYKFAHHLYRKAKAQ